jgi:exopolyphosphatase/guanosine-5'-triphosphate,3'-diphosphate pyrophosphatase
VAAIDCGTNSIRLLIADADRSGGLVEIERRLEIVRLGQGVDATGEFHPDALQRTFAAVDSYAGLISRARVPADRIHFVATSASRDARNRDDFFAGVQSRLGVVPDVISGDEEARLSFAGALGAIRPTAEPVLVMDIGGGSTELIMGSAAGQLERGVSLDIGSVRLTERYLKVNPPVPEDVGEAVRHIDALLDDCGLPLNTVAAWIGVAGTATTLGGVFLGLEAYDRSRVHGTVLPRDDLETLTARLATMTIEQIRALPSMHPGRADVITAGALIACRVASATDAPAMTISEQDILDGIALDLLGPTAGP